MTQKIVNGYDVERLEDTLSMLEAEPKLAKFKFRARNEWISGVYNKTIIKAFYGAEEEHDHSRVFEVKADEPDELLGTDKGPNATEALLHALSSCMIATAVIYAAKKNITIEELTVDIEGEVDLRGIMGLSEDVRPGFSNINVTFNIKADATDEEIREICELSQKHSPVFDTVTNPVPVKVKVNALSSTAAAGV